MTNYKPTNDDVAAWIASLSRSSMPIRDRLAERIKESTLAAYDAKDPSLLLTAEILADEFGVCKATIQGTTKDMAKDGLITRIGSYQHRYAWVAK